MLASCRSLFGAVLLAVTLFASLAQDTSAQPLGAVGASDRAGTMVTKVHGFHCRSELGWDARVGVYRYHRHDGICKGYQRCVAEHRRCSVILGRGWGSWQFERWGFDNWRYTDCMMRHGCY